jgi:hypothetical protein
VPEQYLNFAFTKFKEGSVHSLFSKTFFKVKQLKIADLFAAAIVSRVR